jgi:hypothetical protein
MTVAVFALWLAIALAGLPAVALPVTVVALSTALALLVTDTLLVVTRPLRGCDHSGLRASDLTRR